MPENENTEAKDCQEFADANAAISDAGVRVEIANAINQTTAIAHQLAVEGGWWHDINTGEPLERNEPEMICLMHSELSAAMEALRKNLDDDKLPHRKGVEVELADCVIRIMDFAGSKGMDLGGAIAEKMHYNASREDHKPENRAAEGGKSF